MTLTRLALQVVVAGTVSLAALACQSPTRLSHEKHVLTLTDAIHRMTGLSAERLGLTDRGVIQVGKKADLVIFDPMTIADRATFDEPHQLSTGVEWLLVNGTVVIEKGEPTGALPGRVLRHRSASAPTN